MMGLLSSVGWMVMRGGKGGGAGDAPNRLTSGLGAIRERTIAIGDTVIAVNNVGSVAIHRGRQGYAMAVVGGLIVLVALVTLQSDAGVALILGAIGGVLIAINLNQKLDNGLSIGTCDGRITMIVSTDNDFLGDLLGSND
ncbi:MAG: DUF6232 family protein [Alphaproteobacteria bacterium]|nr:DUF6232 family protein [Alphaproteobacteria bacterium]